MRVPLTEVGRTGRLDLVFGVRDNRTLLLDSYCEVPFKITRLLRTGDPKAAHLMLMQCSPGLFGGDRLELSVVVEPGARVVLTQQSATRVHPSEGRVAFQSTRVQVQSGGELEMRLEPVIPFMESRLEQTMYIDAAQGARVLYWESLMAGRVGRGEKWAFSELKLETSLRYNNRLIYIDRFHVIPEVISPLEPWEMGTHNYLGTGLYLGLGVETRVQAVHDRLPAAGVDSPAEDLVVVRIATDDGPGFHQSRDLLWNSFETGRGDPRLDSVGFGRSLVRDGRLPYSPTGD